MSNKPTSGCLGALLLSLIAAMAKADEPQAESNPTTAFNVRVVDIDNKPLSGALVGVTAYFGSEGDALPVHDDTDWRYYMHARSDENGIAWLTQGRDYLGHLCVVARHPQKRLSAVVNLRPEKLDGIVDVALQPECRVSGNLACRELQRRGRQIEWFNVYLNRSGKRAFGCQSTNQAFHFFVPPGDYVLHAYSEATHAVEREITVRPGQRELVVDAIELPATRASLLEGQPAPELDGVVSWVDSPPLKLANLRGKCVLLDFWGYWCGPCIGRMPALMELHDRYRGQGLVIIGIHVDLGDSIDSAAKLDEKLAPIRDKHWKGRDIPFPVALVPQHETPYGKNIDGMARSELAATYGVRAYPTQVLIGRDGKVVRKIVAESEAHRAILEKALLTTSK